MTQKGFIANTVQFSEDKRIAMRKHVHIHLLFCIALKATPHNSRLTAQAPLRRLRHGARVKKVIRQCRLYSGLIGLIWSFLISETVTVVFALVYLAYAEKKELNGMPSVQ